MPAIIERLVATAKAGDVGASRLLLERVCAPLKPTEAAVTLDIPVNASFTDAARAVIRASADGEIPVPQAAGLLAAVASVARVAEIDEIVRRLNAIEERERQHGQ